MRACRTVRGDAARRLGGAVRRRARRARRQGVESVGSTRTSDVSIDLVTQDLQIPKFS
ncbi:unnamed protein product [Trichogramma brassicae]|uniref:Uncharacterized protein n=1 Tax=Trichogramma brassicae TaxID=86971 RepID=A0A6H5IRX1_9HYME|nr:unnamed protein product [Trichogramma brassicae]